MKILLMCSAGMSTSLLVNKMLKYRDEIGRDDITIEAKPIDDLLNNVDEYDIFLLGPQVKYKEKWAKPIIENKNKKYGIIPPQVYGRIDGKKTLQIALELEEK